MNNLKLTVAERDLLRRVGLSTRAIQLYEHLLVCGFLTAKQAAGLTKELPSAEYRLFKQLERSGLVRRGTDRPVTFTVVAKDVGLRTAYLQFRSGLEQLVNRTVASKEGYRVEIIIGRQALYERYMKLAAESRREICIYAIGIAYSKELERSQQAALKRGVRIRHTLQQIQPSNFHVAHKWQQLGVKVRYAPSERGFHCMIFDAETVLISFSNPEDTDDRLSILTNNPPAVHIFKTDFEAIWRSARRVKV